MFIAIALKKKDKMRARYCLLVECLLNVSENSGLNSTASTSGGGAKMVIFVIYVLSQFIKKKSKSTLTTEQMQNYVHYNFL